MDGWRDRWMDGGMPRSGFKCSVFYIESCFISQFCLKTHISCPVSCFKWVLMWRTSTACLFATFTSTLTSTYMLRHDNLCIKWDFCPGANLLDVDRLSTENPVTPLQIFFFFSNCVTPWELVSMFPVSCWASASSALPSAECSFLQSQIASW